MVKKLREYDVDKDGAINVGRKGLYTWNGEDYVGVEVLAMLNKKARPILTVYEGKIETEVALFEEDGEELFIRDNALGFEENDFVTVGFKDAGCESKWMKWIIVVDRIAGNYPDGYEIINGKADMILGRLSGETMNRIALWETSSAQQWIRKSTEYEINLMRSKAIEDGNQEAIEIIENALKVRNRKEYKFKPFERVLVRDADDEVWAAGIYSYYVDNAGRRKKHGVCGNDYGYEQCIPYEGNEDLWMTTNKPKEK